MKIKIKNGFSASDLNIMEMFFDLSGLEEKPKEEAPVTITTEEEQKYKRT